MAHTTSLSFPNMFNVARNTVSVLADEPSLVNRTRLLILTSPTELYNSPDFGVGLRKYLWQYNTQNVRAIIKDNIIDKLRMSEPYVDPDETTFADGLLFSEEADYEGIPYEEIQQLKMTVAIKPVFGAPVSLQLENISQLKDESGGYVNE